MRRAIQVTEKDREDTYGDPTITLTCAAELKAIFRKYCSNKYSIAHNEAVESALLKVARIAAGTFHEDNYIDASGYLALAGECEKRAEPSIMINWLNNQKKHAKCREDYFELSKNKKKQHKNKCLCTDKNELCRPCADHSKNEEISHGTF